MPSDERKKMNNALKKIVVPILREYEFKGSLPHFRRNNENNIELITFQFNRWGGSFVVELATCSTEGVIMKRGEHIPPNKVTVHDVNKRIRLGAKTEDEDGNWFAYENAKTEEDYEQVALTVADLLNVSNRQWIFSFFD
ncbi:DUF4304 domain-containing protein [Peribacillus sp. SCS-155]|uniref:DUF4304 domain-containing protein n=1 Tax=Peribacillus sedimenti TaxID=3115297 RepID=UPI00390612C8